jgi:hypothetical protein
MNEMMQCDWACLARIERGENLTTSFGAASRARLEAIQFIVTRPHNTLAITGLGRNALMRREYRLSPPAD